MCFKERLLPILQYYSNTVSCYWWGCSRWADCRAKRSISLSHEGRCSNERDFWIQGLRYTSRRCDWQRRWRCSIHPYLCFVGTCSGTNWSYYCWRIRWCRRGRRGRGPIGARVGKWRIVRRKRRWVYIFRRRLRARRCGGGARTGTGRRIIVGPNLRRRGWGGVRRIGWRTRNRSKHDNLRRSGGPSIHYKSWFW